MSADDRGTCYSENEVVAWKTEEVGGSRRITEHVGFSAVCLYVWTLQAAYRGFRQQRGHHRDERPHKCVSPDPLHEDILYTFIVYLPVVCSVNLSILAREILRNVM